MERFQAGKQVVRLASWAGLLAVLFVASWSAAGTDQPASNQSATAKQLLAEAHRLAEAGDMDGAMRLIRQAERLGANDKASGQPSSQPKKEHRSFARSLAERLRWPLSFFGKKKAADQTAGAASPARPSEQSSPVPTNPFRPSRVRAASGPTTQTVGGGRPDRTSPVGTSVVQASPSGGSTSGSTGVGGTPRPEQQLWSKVRSAMAGASEAEQRQMFEYLKTVDPAMVDPILKTWRMARQMGQRKVVEYGQTPAAAAAASQPSQRSTVASELAQRPSGHPLLSALDGQSPRGRLQAPDPRRVRGNTQAASSSGAFGAANPWSGDGRFATTSGRAEASPEADASGQPVGSRSAARPSFGAALARHPLAGAVGSPAADGSTTRLAGASVWADQPQRVTNPIQLGFESASPARASELPSGSQPTTASSAASLGLSSSLPRGAGSRVGASGTVTNPLAPAGPAASPPTATPSPQAASWPSGSAGTSTGPAAPTGLATQPPTAGAGVATGPTASSVPARVQANGAVVGLPPSGAAPGGNASLSARNASAAPTASSGSTAGSGATGSGFPLAPLPKLSNLRTALQSAGQELQHSLAESPLGLGRKRATEPTAGSGQPSASPTDDQLLQQLISLYESQVGQARPGTSEDERLDFVRKHVDLRMLYFVAGHQERALEAIPYIDAADQEFWQQVFWAMSNYFDREGIPDSSDRATQTIAQLKTAIQRLQQNARLQLRNVNFCHKIVSYGNYERFDRDEFTPGQPVLLYAEVENFKSELTPDGLWRTVLKSTIEFYKAGKNGDLVERITFPPTEDLCRNHRRDYFHSYELTIPPKCSLGPHVLKLIVEDQLSQKVATYSVNFVVK